MSHGAVPDHIRQEIEKRERYLGKYLGCLIGGAAGDALGYAVEFMSVPQIRSRYGDFGILDYDLDPKGGKALISDDTQMALFTANAILIRDTRGKLRGICGDSACYASHTYRDWLYTQDHSHRPDSIVSWLVDVPELHHGRAPGNTCLCALGMDAFGSENNPINNSKGSGGVMRVAPAGLYFTDPEEAGRQASGLAALTHGHPLGYISAAAFGYIVSRCTRLSPNAPSDPKRELMDIVEDACMYVRTKWPDHHDAAEYMANLLDKSVELSTGSLDDLDAIACLGEGWVGEEALAIATYAALRHANNFSDAIRCAANHDGDSDSTDAICGNILGSLLGIEAIDSRWTANLELVDVIVEIATDLCRTCQMSEWGSYLDTAWKEKYIR